MVRYGATEITVRWIKCWHCAYTAKVEFKKDDEHQWECPACSYYTTVYVNADGYIHRQRRGWHKGTLVDYQFDLEE